MVCWQWAPCCRTSRHCCRLSWRRLARGGCIVHHHALVGLRLVVGRLRKSQKCGQGFEHVRRRCGSARYTLRSCSHGTEGEAPLSNRLDVHHGGSDPRRNSTLHSQIGSTLAGHLAPTACVAQSRGPWKCKGFSRTMSWDLWLPEKCECRVPHGWVHGQIRSGPRRGQHRTAIAGEYPMQMCQALASVVRVEVRDVP